MNGRNRHMQYRRSVYRRRKLRLVLIASGVGLVLLLILFLVIGTMLGNRSDKEDNETEESQSQIETRPQKKEPLAAVQARLALLETTDPSTFSTRVSRVLATGTNAVSIPLTSPGGALLYRSAVGESLGFPTEGTPAVRIENALGSIDTDGVYASGVFYLTAFSEKNDLLRSVKLAHCAAILAEAGRAGLDEVLLIAPTMMPEHVEELLRFAEDLRLLAPELLLGLTVPSSLLSDEDAFVLMNDLFNGLDLLALSAMEYGEEDPVKHVESLVNDQNLRYYRIRYGMRLLIPVGETDEETQARIGAAEAQRGNNWQLLP